MRELYLYQYGMKLYGLQIADSLGQPNLIQSWVVRTNNEAKAKVLVSAAHGVLPNPLIINIVEVDPKLYNENQTPNDKAIQII